MSSASSPRHQDVDQQQHQHQHQHQQPHSSSPSASLPDLDGPSSFVSSASSTTASRHATNLHDHDTSSIATPEQQEKHPRARRKRTGAHDKMILEDAYRANSKPDKQARLELVSRVSLTEKEVQVWFQNRRQNDRRKSRPLTSEELASLHHSGIRLVDKHGADHCESILKVTHGPVPISLSDPIRGCSSPLQPTHGADASSSHPRSLSFSESGASHHHRQHHQDPPSSQDSQNSARTPSGSFQGLGYIANRRREAGALSAPSIPSDGFSSRPDGTTPSSSQGSTPQSQSQFRLSCSLDGKAELISGNELTATVESPSASAPSAERSSSQPSPRGTATPPNREFRRSYSAAAAAPHSASSGTSSGVRLPSISALLNPASLPRGPSGRSRDVDAWESCASSQTRDELTAMAEKESNGDALARISLIRSVSGSSSIAGHGSTLQPTSGSKRNTQLGPLRSADRRSHGPKRASLGRAMSSVARTEGGSIMSGNKRRKTKADDDGVDVWQSPNAESDKENQSPGRDAGDAHARQPMPRRREPDSPLVPLQDSSARRANAMPPSRAGRRGKDAGPKDIAIFEDDGKRKAQHRLAPPPQVPPRSDDEVERFMRGEVSPSKRGDMDVVTSLLSLSKGAWE